MAWSSKDLDPQMVSSAILAAVENTVPKGGNLPQSQEPKVEANDIPEYNGRMRIMGLDKMANTCYVSCINFYLSQADADRRKGAKGAMVVYLVTENASKFYAATGVPFSSDEDDASMITANGQFAQKLAEAFKAELAAKGYGGLVLSKPLNSKNNIIEGAEFSLDQKTKHEISYFYFKAKALAIDLTLAPIPKK